MYIYDKYVYIHSPLCQSAVILQIVCPACYKFNKIAAFRCKVNHWTYFVYNIPQILTASNTDIINKTGKRMSSIIKSTKKTIKYIFKT